MRILITGKTSYLGNQIATYLKTKNHEVKMISIRNPLSDYDFSSFDVCIHAAGIAHATQKITHEEYFEVNTTLTKSVLDKCIRDKVSHFIFLSSLLVFETQAFIDETIIPKPKTAYAQSKLKAETFIQESSRIIPTTILRLPMVFGPQAKGNYQRLSKISRFTPLFPDSNNKRTFLSVLSLNESIYEIIQNQEKGLFHLGSQTISTFDLVKTIRSVHGKKTFKLLGLKRIIQAFSYLIKPLYKLFSSFYVSDSLIRYPQTGFSLEEEVAHAEGIIKS